MRKFTLRWVAGCCAFGALLFVYGCSSSVSKSYTLLAKLPQMGAQQRIYMAAIDVTGSSCKVSILTEDSGTLWSPDCTVNEDSATHKSFTIGGQQVDMEGTAGNFKATTTLTLPLPATTAVAATTAKPATTAPTAAKLAAKTKTTSGGSAPVAASAAPATPVTGQPFPDQWGQAPYPGHWKLAAQNLGYLVESANIIINGSACELHVHFKVRYPPYDLACVATTDPQGDFTLIFNQLIVGKKALSPTNQILLASEGQSISGLVWDSHGFDGWNPAVPPSWRVAKSQ